MRLSEADASFLYTETASGPMHTASIFVVEGELSTEELTAHFASRMHLVPRYRQKLAFVPLNLAHPKWVDDPDFDLGYHIVDLPLPQGSSLEEGVDHLIEVNQKLLDRSRPLWRAYVGRGVPGKTLLLQQVHHAMIDGVSGVELTMILLDLEPEAESRPPPGEPWRPEPAPTAMELISEALRENMESLSDSSGMAAGATGAGRELLATAGRAVSRFFTSPAITAPWNAGLLGPNRKLRWLSYDFAEFREIRRAFGGTINDVVLAVVSEAGARYLDRHREDSADKHFRIMCPVSVRTEDEQGALGNRVSGIFPSLPAWSMSMPERLRSVCEETTRIKEGQEAQALTLMNEASPPMPAAMMAPTLLVGTSFDPTALAARFPLPVAPRLGGRPPLVGFNFTCTNVPGVQVPLYVVGHKVSDWLGILMLGGNLGFGVAVISYNQRMQFGFICETRLMPDLEVMIESAETAFGELLEAAREVNATATSAA